MSRRDVRMERGEYPPPPPPSQCAKVLYYTWKLCSVVFSHFLMISLVVAYCILGAVTFEKLEAQYEREVKMNISKIRHNTTQSIWSMTSAAACLNQSNWTMGATDMLKDFENAILLEMKVRGWDGTENPEHIQWTFTGALFYSIIVITTIGYGHIVPKTQTGKVVTIFYAILGIPLMLLCLSNIGDVMASSFRFLYWRVCCYVCTRPPKRRSRHHHARRSVRGGSGRGSTRRRRPAPAPAPALERAHSDTDCRYRDSGYSSSRRRQPPAARTRSQPPAHHRTTVPGPKDFEPEEFQPPRLDRFTRDPYNDDEEEFPKITLPLQDLEAALRDLDSHQVKMSKQELRSKSLPRPVKSKPDYGPRRDFDDSRYEDDDKEVYEMHDLDDVDYENYREKKAREIEDRERMKLDRDEFQYRDRGYDPEDDDYEFDSPRGRRGRQDRERSRYNRGRSEYYDRDENLEFGRRERTRRARSAFDPEPRWPDARRLRRLHTVDDSMRGHHRYHTPSPEREGWSDEPVALPKRPRPPATWGSRHSDIYVVQEAPTKEEIKPVPIWLCVLLVASYIVVGTFLFKRWEGWAYLDAAYFCFITLTTIGFGDFVPAQGQSQTGNAIDAVHSLALCSLYLLFGIALLAMSFNLVQEEVRANVAALATRLGIIKSKVQEESDSDY